MLPPPPPHKPYCFHRQQKSYFFTWTISIFLHIFPKTCRNCRVRSFIFLHFLGQKVKFSFPFVFSLKLFFNNLWFSLSHRLSVCLKFAQPINSGTFKKKYFCIRYLDYQSASLCRYRWNLYENFGQFAPKCKNYYKTYCVTVKY